LCAYIGGSKKLAPRIFGPCLSHGATFWALFGRLWILIWAVSNKFAKQLPKRLAARFLGKLNAVLQLVYPLWSHKAARMASRSLFQTDGKGGPAFEFSLGLSLL
jgi:hypothetical protein